MSHAEVVPAPDYGGMRPIIAVALVALLMPAPASADNRIVDEVCEMATKGCPDVDIDQCETTSARYELECLPEPCLSAACSDPCATADCPEPRGAVAAAKRCLAGRSPDLGLGVVDPLLTAACDAEIPEIGPLPDPNPAPGAAKAGVRSVKGAGCAGELTTVHEQTTVGLAVGTWFVLGYQHSKATLHYKFACDANAIVEFGGKGGFLRTVTLGPEGAPAAECEYDGIVAGGCDTIGVVPIGTGGQEGTVRKGERYPTSATFCSPMEVTSIGPIGGRVDGGSIGCVDVPIVYETSAALQAVLDLV